MSRFQTPEQLRQAAPQYYPGSEASFHQHVADQNRGQKLADLLPPHQSYGVSEREPPASISKPRLSSKTRKRILILVPIGVLIIGLIVLYEIHKDDIKKWLQPASDWLAKNDEWSWLIPTAILIVLSIPPLVGAELVLLIVGVAFTLQSAIGICVISTILGEALCFGLFKRFFTSWVDKKRAENVDWAAMAEVAGRADMRMQLAIRYSIIPSHLSNPIFATTGTDLWPYMLGIVLSLPKQVALVAIGCLGAREDNPKLKWANLAIIAILILVTLLVSQYVNKAVKEARTRIKLERGMEKTMASV